MDAAAQDDTSPFVSLIYSSSATMPFDKATLGELEFRAQLHNQGKKITGYLTYRDERFTQVLEGPRDAVDELMATIRADERHTITCEIELSTENRRFPNWSMRLLKPLWFPSGSMLDAIDEVLATAPTTPADVQAVRPALEKLVAEVAVYQ